MGSTTNTQTINYKDQQQFNQFFATSFDKYDKNKDGKIDYREFQPLINDMCQTIIKKYGNGPTVDKIKQAWCAMDTNKSGYITRQEFTTKAKKEIEKILSQPNQPGYGHQPQPQGYGAHPQPGYGHHPQPQPQPHGFVQPHGPHGYH